MTTIAFPGADTESLQALRERLAAATEFLEQVADNRALLVPLDPAERQRFLDAVATVFHPDAKARRNMVKATVRARKAALANRDDETLQQTGIRVLRRQRTFTTPNVYPPDALETHASGAHGVAARDAGGDATARDATERDPTDSYAAQQRAEQAVVPQHCYVCKAKFTTIHFFYDQLCPSCAAFNYAKRSELADLSGRVALLTGGRVKIGYQAGIKLLRAGAKLIVTTRFPRNSAMRYAAEPDFDMWGDRLEIYGLDLRHTPSVETFCTAVMEANDRLDFIINNACQTVRRPPEFYRHMMEEESASLHSLNSRARHTLVAYEAMRRSAVLPERALSGASEGSRLGALVQHADKESGHVLADAAALSQLALLPEEFISQHDAFPAGQLDQDLQQADLRDRNSWRFTLSEVPTVELLETQLVNAVAPFVLNARLKALMLRTPSRDKHIVNVSAMEGQFYRHNKTTRHPHTNMAKAALNMMTRTSAADYQQDGIHMNSVDTGWVTDEDTVALAARKVRDHRFHPPLDIVDGAARIVDPIIDGVNTGTHVWGQFLKDYKPTDW